MSSGLLRPKARVTVQLPEHPKKKQAFTLVMANFCAAVGLSAFIGAVRLCDVDCFANDAPEMAAACFDVQNKMAVASHAEEPSQQEPRFIHLDASTIKTHKGTFKVTAGQEVYIFDIDETLYPHDDEILKMRREKIVELGMLYGLSREETEIKIKESMVKYKSTIKGFIRELPRNEDVNKVLHNPIPNAADTLKPDTELRKMLLRLKGRRVCLTNGPRDHSRKALAKLGILDCFDAVFCCDYKNSEYLSKPDPDVYDIVSQVLELDKASDVYFFDDRSENIEFAIPFGWSCSLVTRRRPLKLILRELLDGCGDRGSGEGEEGSHAQSVCA